MGMFGNTSKIKRRGVRSGKESGEKKKSQTHNSHP